MPNLYLPAINQLIQHEINLAGSKSIANRVLALASIASGTSIISNVTNDCDDVNLMLIALKQLGVKITLISTNYTNNSSSYAIEGAQGVFNTKSATIFCENSGTCMRFLTAILALQPQAKYTLTGIKRMEERPIIDLINGLSQLGANITYIKNPGYPPLIINDFKYNHTKSIIISGKTSSQYLTGLLMAIATNKLNVTISIADDLISKSYANITIDILTKFGAKIIANNMSYTNLPSNLQAIEYTIEPDASSASYFLAIGALAGTIQVNNLSEHSIQGDKNFAKVLKQMGAVVEYLPNAIKVSKAPYLNAININMQDMPDTAMTLAVVCLFALGTSTITGISSWQFKETNRLQAMYNELTKLGAMVTFDLDSITITPPKHIKHNVSIDTYNDHRMAMAFSIVASTGVSITINNYKCVNKTFANYFELFKQCCY